MITDKSQIQTKPTSLCWSQAPTHIMATIANGGQVQNSNGYDIVFTSDSAGTNKLNFEIETYNPATGAIVAWVQVPTLSHTADTTIYLQYGDTSVSTNQQNQTGVWDSNYKSVWHFGGGATLTANDSTSNGNNGTLVNSPTVASGQIGAAAGFTPANSQYISAGLATAATTNVTLSAWIQWNGTSQESVVAYNGSYGNGWGLTIGSASGGCSAGGSVGLLFSFITCNALSATSSLTAGQWTYVVLTRGSTTWGLYANGVLITTGTSDPYTPTSSFLMGEIGSSSYFGGELDEVRVSNIARSLDWIATEYNNQSSPSAFYTVSGVDGITLSLSPTTASLAGGQTQQFTATVSNSSNTNVTWSLSPNVGSISSAGLYTAPANIGGPQIVTVTATSVADSSTSATAIVTLNPPAYFTYNYYRAIAISHAKVPNTDQTNFPVLISGVYPYLATVANGGQVQSASGYDVVFTSDSAGENKLNFEIESYNPSTGAITAWVEVPTVSHTSDTVVYLQYGNSIISASLQNKTGTWDSNYQGVWHLAAGSTLTGNDSTTNGNNGTLNNGITTTAGEFGTAASFNAANSQYIAAGLGSSASTNVTLSAWVQWNGAALESIVAYNGSNSNGWGLRLGDSSGACGGTGGYVSVLFGGVSCSALSSTYGLTSGQWTYLTLTQYSGTWTLYANGVSEATGTTSPSAPTSSFTMGEIGSHAYFSGGLEEVRLSSTARSADWIATEYNNQSSPASFYTVSGVDGITLSLSPTAASLSGGQTQQFTATVSNSSNTSVNWSLNPNVGTISSSGLYTAPANIGSLQTVTVTATSAADPTTNVAASVTLNPPPYYTYSYYRAITTNHAKVPNSDEANFPVLISGIYPYLATVANGGQVQSANGYDIVFTSDSAGTTKLNYEIESYNSTTGAIVAWVQVPTLSHTSDTVIYLQYGNSIISVSQQNKTGTWDSNYQGVWHLSSGGSLTGNDSTANGNNGTLNNGITTTTGEFGTAAGFNAATSQYISAGLGSSASTNVTLSAWVQWNGAALESIVAYNGSNSNGWGLRLGDSSGACGGTGGYVSVLFGGITCSALTSTYGLTSGQWTYLTLTQSSGTWALYANGVSEATGTASPSAPTSSFTMGEIGSHAYFSGGLEEVRLSSTARSADWIATEYNNQSSPAAFYSVSGADGITLSLSPTAASLSGGQTQQFTATVSNSSNTSVSWSLNPNVGTISNSGLYTAPANIGGLQTVTVTAASAADPTTTAIATVTLNPPPYFTYTYYRAIAISHAKVPNTDQTNFPVLISGVYPYLATVANGGQVQSANGYDIVFTSDSAGTTKLNYEIESYNSTTGAIVAWVQVPTLSHTSDTVIYLQYGSSIISVSQQNKTGTWDSNYQGVWHLSSGGSLTGNDSTANGNNGTLNNGITTTTGEFGTAAGFNAATSQYISAGLGSSASTNVTLSAWVQWNGAALESIVAYKGSKSKGWGHRLGDSSGACGGQGGHVSVLFGGITCSALTSTYGLTSGQWTYLTLTQSSGTWTLYANGVSQATGTASPSAPTSSFTMGEIGSHAYFSGGLEEVRISSTARSADWTATEYNNQSSPASFYTVRGANGLTVSVSPLTASLFPSQTQQFTATITNSSNTSVTWVLSPNVGTISTAGLYTAPSTVSTQQTVVVTATSAADGTQWASAAVTLNPAVTVTVSPTTASLYASQAQQFNVTVTGSSNTSVTWSLSPSTGTINSTGLYTAPSSVSTPQSVTVTATSIADNLQSASATLALNPPPSTPLFVSTVGSMVAARFGQTTTRLATGQILLAGGQNSSGALASSELYNPASQTFTASGAMTTTRWMHTATLLNDGTVLIAGGSNATSGATLDTAEIYNPTTGTFSLLSNSLNTARAGHTATLLNNGQVLLVGGIDPTAGILSDAELYDPPSQTFIDLGNTNDPRYRHTATVLQNGQVLIAGGETDPNPTGAFNTAEVFDPTAQTFAALDVPMTSGREGHVAVLMNNGQVLLAGGDNDGAYSLTTAEIFNPALGVFTPVPYSMMAGRFSANATLLNGGNILITGGATDSGSSNTELISAEVFSPVNQTFSNAGDMTIAREYDTASLLNDGSILIAGGTNGAGALNSAELYLTSQLSGLVSIAVTPATPSAGVGAQQSFVATGTFSNSSTQQLASVLWSSSSASVAPISGDSTNTGAAPATAQGTATITASASGVSGTATFTVTAPTITSFSVSPESAAIPRATTQQFAATGTYSDGSTQDLTANSTWTSTATSIAPITSGGLATGLTLGIATIQANYGSWSSSTGVTVVGPTLVSLSITPATTSIASGTSQQYHATGTFSDYSTQDLTAVVAWSSGTTSVATITTAGLVTAAAQGSSTITAASGSVTISGSLTVGAPTLASLAITPDVAVISTTGTQQLAATGTYTDSSTQNLTTSTSWTSSNTGAVTVNSSGLATAVAAGSATITGTIGTAAGTALIVVSSGSTQTNLITSRYQHSATTLDNGSILIAGGQTCPSSGSCSYLSSAEIYNPATDTFASTGAMAAARSAPALLLNSGNVLVAGGYTCDSSGNCSSLNRAEIYNPASGTFSSAGTMIQSRSAQTMTLLGNGTVLIAGGETCTSATSCTAQSTAEIYDPVAGTFTATLNNMSAARFGASAVALNSGLVLIAGGFNGTNFPAAAELYDPGSNTFQGIGPNLSVPRFAATATLLNNGQVLVAGGSTCALPGCPTNAAEVYDPVGIKFFLIAGGLTAQRFDHTATLTTNGQVYIAGGYSSCSSTCTSVASTEVFDPVAGTFDAGQTVTNALAGHTATLVGNGNVLLMGGTNSGVTLAGDAWYQPANLAPAGLISIAVTPASGELMPGQTQQFVATGTFNDGSTETLQSALWNSSNPAAAAVSNSGAANGVAPGAATVTAAVGDMSGSASVSVVTLVSLAITPANPTLPVGAAEQFTVIGTMSDGSTLNLTTTAGWSVTTLTFLAPGAPVVENLSQPGLVGAGAVGTASIMASIGGISATTVATVQAPSPASPVITSISPQSGGTNTLVAIAGSGFGSTQGTVWLGSTIGTVVSWGSTLITATVASNAMTGVVQVQQGGVWSNSIAFTVNTTTISSVSPPVGEPGTQVTIMGSNFGAAPGQVFIGNANALVVNWSNTQVTAVVTAQAAPGTGNLQLLVNNVMSNAVAFTVDSLQITAISPTSGPVGTSVTFHGYGFGASQGNSSVSIGNAPGQVQSWNDNTVVVTVAGTLSGPAYIEQDGVSSNGKHFTVTSSGGNMMLTPEVISMVVGGTSPIQALNSSGQPMTGLTWTSSNSNIVSLSTANPPILTAVAVGHVSITAGTAIANVTVSATAPPIGTILWSNPGDGSGVAKIVPAVPSATGVADVFALQNDGTVQAIASDGTTAWTADASSALNGWGSVLPDFQGGLVLLNEHSGPGYSIAKLDGATGQQVSIFAPADGQSVLNDELTVPAVIHPDGTLFAVQANNSQGISVIGIELATGTQKFSVPVEGGGDLYGALGLIVAGDGYAYFCYQYQSEFGLSEHLRVLRVDSNGASNSLSISDQYTPRGGGIDFGASIITNADQGILVNWSFLPDGSGAQMIFGMATTDGTTVAGVSPPTVPGQGGAITPVLQAQDGSFVGTAYVGDDSNTPYMVAFDASGNVRWAVPNDQPQIATADGVVGQTGITYDSNGNATGQLGNLPTYSWLGNYYQVGSIDQVLWRWLKHAVSFWPFQGANASQNATAVQQPLYDPLESCPGASVPCPQEALMSAIGRLRILLQNPCSLCTNWVFSKLGIDQVDFYQYLLRRPRLYDGTRSYAKGSEALCAPGFFYQAGCRFASKPVQYYMDTSEALSQTPSYSTPIPGRLNLVLAGMQTFFNPSAICRVFSVSVPPIGDQGVLNQALLFHEALHGYSGGDDTYLESHFGLPVTFGYSNSITVYVQDNAIPGGPYGSHQCRN